MDRGQKPRAARPLWTCPQCRRRFANRNQQHACGRHRLAPHFSGKPKLIREIFDAFAAAVRENGAVTVIPERTRIAFHVRMSFAQLTPRRGWVDGHLVLARRADSPVFTRVESFSARNHLHAFRLTTPGDVTRELRRWIAEAYSVGEQRHLDRTSASRRARK